MKFLLVKDGSGSLEDTLFKGQQIKEKMIFQGTQGITTGPGK